MGELIGVWSPYRGTGRTTITLAIAYKIARLCRNKKVLLCCANGSSGTLIKTMGVSSEDIGIEDLVSFKLAGFTSSEYEKMLEKKGGVYFAGSSKMTPAFSERYISEFGSVINELKDRFDISILDLPYGYKDTLCNEVLLQCDKIITVLEQDDESIQSIGFDDKLLNKNIIVINKYKEEALGIPENKDVHGYSRELYKVPFCDVLAEMSRKGKQFQYLSLKTDFCNKIENIISCILELDESNVFIPEGGMINKKLIRKLKINFVGGQQ